jgi:tetratricopeptide (TPR) repeat protein
MTDFPPTPERSPRPGGAALEGRGVAGALVVLLTLAAYSPALFSGFIWDDDQHVTENATLRSAEGLARIWLEPRSIPQYYPVTHTTFWLEYRLWGVRPLGYHLVNVLLHVANALLVWTALRRLGFGADVQHTALREATERAPLGAAWLVGAIFALHPVHVESVAWITERKNVLSGTFYLAALLVLLPVLGLARWPGGDGGARPASATSEWARYALGCVLFVAALLSKSVTCSLPAALLLLVWWKRGRIDRRALLATAPMFAVGLAAGLHTAYLERVHVGAGFVDWDLGLIERSLVACRAIVFYAWKLVWPEPLVFSYPRWEIDATSPDQWIYPLLVLGTLATLFLARRRLGRGPLVAILFFAGTLSPALGFVDVYPMVFSWVADHFQYLASLGLISLLVATAATLAEPWRKRARLAAPALVVLLLATLATLTFRQALTYRDAETLWRSTLERNPASWMARDNLAELLLERARSARDRAEALRLRAEATRLLEESLELHRDKPALVSLAQVFMETGRAAEAVELYRAALELEPTSAELRNNLAVALGALGREEEQTAELVLALESDPDHLAALRNLAALELTAASEERRDPAAALELAGRAVALTGGRDPMVLAILAEASWQLGRTDEALAAVGRAIELAAAQEHGADLVAALEAKRREYVQAATAPPR